MTLIDDHVNPLDLGEEWTILDDVLVRGEKNLEIGLSHPLLFNLAGVWSSSIADEVNGRSPFLELVLPVGESAKEVLVSQSSQQNLGHT
jgi:hypothetical protein